VLGSWGLDDDLVAAVAFYAEPSAVAGAEAGPLLAVHSAVALSDPIFLPPDQAYLARLGVLDRWDAWQQAVAEGGVAG
jgi:hypothetical protein